MSSVELTPLEKFRMLKAGESVPVAPPSVAPTPEAPLGGETAEQKQARLKGEVVSAPTTETIAERQERLRTQSSMIKGDADQDPNGVAHYKRLDEHCDHPKDRRRRESGKLVTITVCGDCGRIVDDPDLRT
jgi:hypothetical protein